MANEDAEEICKDVAAEEHAEGEEGKGKPEALDLDDAVELDVLHGKVKCLCCGGMWPRGFAVAPVLLQLAVLVRLPSMGQTGRCWWVAATLFWRS